MSRYTDVGTIPLRSTSEEEFLQEMMARAREETMLSDIINAMMGGGELPEGLTGFADLLGMAPLGLQSGMGREQAMMREVMTKRLMEMIAQDEAQRLAKYNAAAQYSAATKPAHYATQKPENTKWYDKLISGMATGAGSKMGDLFGEWGGTTITDLATSGWDAVTNMFKGSGEGNRTAMTDITDQLGETMKYVSPTPNWDYYGKDVYSGPASEANRYGYLWRNDNAAPMYQSYESAYQPQNYYFESAPTYSMSNDPSLFGF